MGSMSMAEQAQQQVIAYVFLGLMVMALILAITTFEGTPTIVLILSAIVFLVVGLTMLGGGSGSRGDAGGQQQSVVIGGRTIRQSSGQGILTACSACSGRIPETAKFCPGCGSSVA